MAVTNLEFVEGGFHFIRNEFKVAFTFNDLSFRRFICCSSLLNYKRSLFKKLFGPSHFKKAMLLELFFKRTDLKIKGFGITCIKKTVFVFTIFQEFIQSQLDLI